MKPRFVDIVEHRQLVESQLWLNKIIQVIQEPTKKLLIKANKRDISNVVGQKKCNIISLKEMFSLDDIHVKETSIPDGEIHIVTARDTIVVRK